MGFQIQTCDNDTDCTDRTNISYFKPLESAARNVLGIKNKYSYIF